MVIMHAAHVGGDVDIAQIMRMFENGAFDEALGRAKRKKNGNPEAKAEPEPEAAKRRDVAAAKRFFRARENGENEHEMDDVPTLARYGVTGEALPNDAATTWPSGVRSTPSRETRKVEFLNARSSTTAVYWVDFDGKETHYVDLPPGMSTLMSTFATHSWVARDMASARAIAVFTVQPRADSTQNSNARLTDQERPRRFVVVDAAERGEEIDASETLVKTRREIPAPAPAEPEKPEKQTEPEKEPTDMQSDDRSRGGGREPERESGGRRAESVRVRRREGTVMYFSFVNREEDARHSYHHAGRVLVERARYDSPDARRGSEEFVRFFFTKNRNPAVQQVVSNFAQMRVQLAPSGPQRRRFEAREKLKKQTCARACAIADRAPRKRRARPSTPRALRADPPLARPPGVRSWWPSPRARAGGRRRRTRLRFRLGRSRQRASGAARRLCGRLPGRPPRPRRAGAARPPRRVLGGALLLR